MNEHTSFADVDGIELAAAFLEAFPIGTKTLRRAIDEFASAHGVYSVEASQDTINYNFTQMKEKINRAALGSEWAEKKLPPFRLEYLRTTSTGRTEWEVAPIEVAFETRALAGIRQMELAANTWVRESRRLHKVIVANTTSERLRDQADHALEQVEQAAGQILAVNKGGDVTVRKAV